jgi:hypothetical protein
VAGDTPLLEPKDPSGSQPLLRGDSRSIPISEPISAAKNNFCDSSLERPDHAARRVDDVGFKEY